MKYFCSYLSLRNPNYRTNDGEMLLIEEDRLNEFSNYDHSCDDINDWMWECYRIYDMMNYNNKDPELSAFLSKFLAQASRRIKELSVDASEEDKALAEKVLAITERTGHLT